MLFRRGLNAKIVQHWLGHHSPAFTLATYVHLLPDDLPEVDFFALDRPRACRAEMSAGNQSPGSVSISISRSAER